MPFRIPRASAGPRAVSLLAIALLGAVLAGCGSSGGGSASGDQDQPAPQTSEVSPPATLAVSPANLAVDVSPAQPITVTAANGTIGDVVVTNPDGKVVAGAPGPDGRTWSTTEPLGYGKTYTVDATATGTDGNPVTSTSSFTTVTPATETYPSMNPIDGETVGIGQPLAVYFDEPISNKQAAEDAITITTEPAVGGSFYWFSDKEVHWRPQEFWAPGTAITMDIAIYGKDLGDGVYGQEDRTADITIGDAVIARADGASHQMSVEVNGAIARTMPISMGSSEFPSNNGVHVVSERHADYTMDSSTYGLEPNEGGYVTDVQFATRISNGGEFVHAAPWSVGQQGNSNVSHGCINLSTENAEWFYNTVKKGDVVINTNTGGPDLRSWDGFGDWQIPWAQWQTGGPNR